MKLKSKLISAVTALAMLMCMSTTAFAALQVKQGPSTAGWSVNEKTSGSTLKTGTDYINGKVAVTQTVGVWHISNTSDGNLIYPLGALTPGAKYRVYFRSITSGMNQGTRTVDILWANSCVSSGQGYSLGEYDRWSRNTDGGGYRVFNKTVTIPATETRNLYLAIHKGYGDNNFDIKLADVRVEKVNDDGTYGENLVKNGNFTADVSASLTSGWGATNGTLSTDIATVNGERENVCKWQWTGSGANSVNASLYQKIGKLSAGKYRFAASIYSPNNAGERQMGLTTAVTGDQNAYLGKINYAKNTAYTSYSGTVDITDETSDYYFNIHKGYGDANPIWISSAAVQKISYDAENNEILGENLLANSEFDYVEQTPITTGWEAGNGADSMVYQYDRIGSVIKPCMYWSFPGGSSSAVLKTHIGTLKPATYRITVNFGATGNPGDSFVGLTNDSTGGFPDNGIARKSVLPFSASDYAEYTWDETIEEAQAGVDQYLNFFTQYGEAAKLKIASVSVRKVNSNGTLGRNLVVNPDFVTVYNPDDYVVALSNEHLALTVGEDTTVLEDLAFDEGMTLHAYATVENGTDEDITPVIVLAVYHGATLIDVAVDSSVKVESGSTAQLTCGWTATELGDENYTGKIMVWDSLGTMIPYGTVYSLSN